MMTDTSTFNGNGKEIFNKVPDTMLLLMTKNFLVRVIHRLKTEEQIMWEVRLLFPYNLVDALYSYASYFFNLNFFVI